MLKTYKIGGKPFILVLSCFLPKVLNAKYAISQLDRPHNHITMNIHILATLVYLSRSQHLCPSFSPLVECQQWLRVNSLLLQEGYDIGFPLVKRVVCLHFLPQVYSYNTAGAARFTSIKLKEDWIFLQWIKGVDVYGARESLEELNVSLCCSVPETWQKSQLLTKTIQFWICSVRGHSTDSMEIA